MKIAIHFCATKIVGVLKFAAHLCVLYADALIWPVSGFKNKQQWILTIIYLSVNS